jgi:hypothetical protein
MFFRHCCGSKEFSSRTVWIGGGREQLMSQAELRAFPANVIRNEEIQNVGGKIQK